MRLLRLLPLTAALLVLAPAAASAASCTTLENTVAATASGGTVNVAGVNTGCHISYVGKSLTFQGTTPDAAFDGGDGTHSIISAQGPGANVFRSLTFRNATTPTQSGAAIQLSGDASAQIVGSHFVANQATTGSGGAIFISGNASSLLVQNSTFGSTVSGQGNSAPDSSGGAIYTALNTGSVTIEHTTFTGNSARGGGAVALNGQGVTLTADTFGQNTASTSAGAVAISDGGSPTVQGSRFIGNSVNSAAASSSGRTAGALGITARDRAVNQTANLFQDNTVTYNRPSDDGEPSGGGGELVNGMLVSRGDRFIHNAVRNTAVGGPATEGGGLFVFGCVNMNNAPHTPARAENLVAAGNSVGPGGEGAGVYAGCAAVPVDLTLNDSTIAGNTGGSPLDGGAMDTLRLVNSIVSAGGKATAITGFASRAIAFSDACAPGGHKPAGAGNLCADPLLKNPANGDIHQTSKSPTRDRGSNPRVPAGLSTDFEGNPRITDAEPNGYAVVDIGADETPTGRLTIHGLKLSPKTFKTTGTHPGTTISFTISGPAGVRYSLARLLSHGKRHAIGSFVHNAHAGHNNTRFTGRVGHTVLTPGHYRLTLKAKNRLGNRSNTATINLTVTG
jgi:hypothetical protein